MKLTNKFLLGITLFFVEKTFSVEVTSNYNEKLYPNNVRVFCTKLNPSKLSIFSISTEHKNAIYSLVTPRAWPIESCIMKRNKFLKIKKDAKWLVVFGHSMHENNLIDDELDYFGKSNPPYNNRKSIWGEFVSVQNDRGECLSYFDHHCSSNMKSVESSQFKRTFLNSKQSL